MTAIFWDVHLQWWNIILLWGEISQAALIVLTEQCLRWQHGYCWRLSHMDSPVCVEFSIIKKKKKKRSVLCRNMVKAVQSHSTKPSAKFMQIPKLVFWSSLQPFPFSTSLMKWSNTRHFSTVLAPVSAWSPPSYPPLGCSPRSIPKITKFSHASWVADRHLS